MFFILFIFIICRLRAFIPYLIAVIVLCSLIDFMQDTLRYMIHVVRDIKNKLHYIMFR